MWIGDSISFAVIVIIAQDSIDILSLRQASHIPAKANGFSSIS